MLISVEVKNSPADSISIRDGWSLIHFISLGIDSVGRNVLLIDSRVLDADRVSKFLLWIAQPVSHRSAIAPANERSNATFGTSTYAIRASELR